MIPTSTRSGSARRRPAVDRLCCGRPGGWGYWQGPAQADALGELGRAASTRDRWGYRTLVVAEIGLDPSAAVLPISRSQRVADEPTVPLVTRRLEAKTERECVTKALIVSAA